LATGELSFVGGPETCPSCSSILPTHLLTNLSDGLCTCECDPKQCMLHAVLLDQSMLLVYRLCAPERLIVHCQTPKRRVVMPFTNVLPRLIVPLLIQVVYQPILIFVPASSSPTVLAKRDAAVAPAGRHKARTRGSKNDEHVLHDVSNTNKTFVNVSSPPGATTTPSTTTSE
jgi:hypothetical protein